MPTHDPNSLDFVSFLNAAASAAPARPTREQVMGAISYEQRRERAAAYLDGMTVDELKTESNGFKHALLTYLNRELRAEDRPALSKLYQAFSLDGDFASDEKAKMDSLAEILKQDETLAKAQTHWAKLTPQLRARVMQHVADIHSKHMGFQPVKVGLFEAEADDKGRIKNGYYDRKAGDIKLNAHANAKLANFAGALNLIIHENSHNHQVQLARKFELGAVPKTDPRHVQARIFKENLKDGSYIVAHLDYAAYRAQPLELHANAAGAYLARRVMEPPLSPAMRLRAEAAKPGAISMGSSAAAIQKARAEGKDVVFHLDM